MFNLYLLQGFKLLRHKKLCPFVIVPLIINIVIFAALLVFFIHAYSSLVAFIDHLLPSWLQWLNWLLWFIFALANILAITYIFSIIANLVAAPFNSFLAEKAEHVLSGKNNSTTFMMQDIPRIMRHEGQKIIYYIPRALLCLLLFFIPGLQVIAPFIWFLFNSWMMSIQYLDYPMDNHRINFRTMRRMLGEKKPTNLAFGATVMIASMIPIINFLVIPAAVVGATILWYNHYQVGP